MTDRTFFRFPSIYDYSRPAGSQKLTQASWAESTRPVGDLIWRFPALKLAPDVTLARPPNLSSPFIIAGLSKVQGCVADKLVMILYRNVSVVSFAEKRTK